MCKTESPTFTSRRRVDGVLSRRPLPPDTTEEHPRGSRKSRRAAGQLPEGCGRVQAKIGASVIDTLVISKIRSDSVKRMTQIQNTSWSFAETKDFGVAAREHTLVPPGRHRPRHSRMSLAACQSTPAIDGAIYRPDRTLYQLQPSFHTQSTEPEPTARARRAGEEFY